MLWGGLMTESVEKENTIGSQLHLVLEMVLKLTEPSAYQMPQTLHSNKEQD